MVFIPRSSGSKKSLRLLWASGSTLAYGHSHRDDYRRPVCRGVKVDVGMGSGNKKRRTRDGLLVGTRRVLQLRGALRGHTSGQSPPPDEQIEAMRSCSKASCITRDYNSIAPPALSSSIRANPRGISSCRLTLYGHIVQEFPVVQAKDNTMSVTQRDPYADPVPQSPPLERE